MHYELEQLTKKETVGISCRTKLCDCILMKAPRSRADGASGYRNNVYYIPQQAAGN